MRYDTVLLLSSCELVSPSRACVCELSRTGSGARPSGVASSSEPFSDRNWLMVALDDFPVPGTKPESVWSVRRLWWDRRSVGSSRQMPSSSTKMPENKIKTVQSSSLSLKHSRLQDSSRTDHWIQTTESLLNSIQCVLSVSFIHRHTWSQFKHKLGDRISEWECTVH